MTRSYQMTLLKVHIHLKGVPEEKNKENVRKEIIEKITAKN